MGLELLNPISIKSDGWGFLAWLARCIKGTILSETETHTDSIGWNNLFALVAINMPIVAKMVKKKKPGRKVE